MNEVVEHDAPLGGCSAVADAAVVREFSIPDPGVRQKPIDWFHLASGYSSRVQRSPLASVLPFIEVQGAIMSTVVEKLFTNPLRSTLFIRRGLGALVIGSTVISFGLAFATSYEEAHVLSADPVYRTVSSSVPVERCHEQEVVYHEPQQPGSATPTILGAVIGGAIGNAVGHHKENKLVGTAVGAVLGGSIGTDIGRRVRANQASVTRTGTEQVCQSVNEVREQEELAGYDVEYSWGGQVFRTQTQNHPGQTLRVRVDVSPAE
jgi:uncharacterized protein YcfJ